jgi:hypothetical protein
MHVYSRNKLNRKAAAFCVVAPYNMVEIYMRFGGSYCFHHEDDKWHSVLMRILLGPDYGDKL